MNGHLNPAFKHKAEPFILRSLHYMRKNEDVSIKKVPRKRKLKILHIFPGLLLICGIFVAIQQAYLFVISWEKLEIQKIQVFCSKAEVQEDVEKFMHGKKLGNILLFNIKKLQESLESHPWIKKVEVKRRFPAILKIDIQERIPEAVLESHKLYLIDREGVLLEEIEPGKRADLPLFTDKNKFQKDLKEKLKLAWACLDSLKAFPGVEIEIMDLSLYGNVSFQLKGSSTWFLIGQGQYAEKFQSYLACKKDLGKYGDLEYADLRLSDRLIIRPQTMLANSTHFISEKEAN